MELLTVIFFLLILDLSHKGLFVAQRDVNLNYLFDDYFSFGGFHLQVGWDIFYWSFFFFFYHISISKCSYHYLLFLEHTILEQHHPFFDASTKLPPSPPHPVHISLYVQKNRCTLMVWLWGSLKKAVWTFELCIFKI